MSDRLAATARVLVRPNRRSELAITPPLDSPRRFHTTMPEWAATPLRDAPTTARRLGVAEVLVKDESLRLGLLSFKILGAPWAVCRAVAARRDHGVEEIASFDALRRAVHASGPSALSAATDGNHGRAVAYMAQCLGIDAHIFLPRGTAQARSYAIASEGARVTTVDGGYDDTVQRAAKNASEDCIVIADTTSHHHDDTASWVIEGYGTMFAEMEEQLAARGSRRPTLVVVPIGVGALAAAAVRHFWNAPSARPQILGVEPSSAACVLESVANDAIITLEHPQASIMAGLNCGTPSAAAWPLVSQGIDVYLAIGDARVPEEAITDAR